MHYKHICGNWATLLLPINSDQSIDFARLEAEILYLIEARVDGIYSNGSAGEFYTQSEAEFDRVSEILAQCCEQAQMPFQIGASHYSPQIALERIRRAAALKPSAIQVILPDWFPPSDEEMVAALEGYAEAAEGIGLVLYNPPHAKRVLQPEQLLWVKQRVPAIVGTKVADGDEGWYARMRPVAAQMSVFVPGHHLATGFARGVASGAYSNVACLSPKGAGAWWKQMQRDLQGALELEQRICGFMDAHIAVFKQQGYQNVALDKLLAAIGGWGDVGTRVRWPYRSIDTEVAVELRKEAMRWIPELMQSAA